MNKSPDAFRTISEVAEWLDVPKHVLRFWESKFAQVKPVKRAGGRRYYRPGDMELLGGIKRLLHDDGLTIRGVQKLLREEGVRHVADLCPEAVEDRGLEALQGSESQGEPAADEMDRPDIVTAPRDEAGRETTERTASDATAPTPSQDAATDLPRTQPDAAKVDAILRGGAPVSDPHDQPGAVPQGDAQEGEPVAPTAAEELADHAFELPIGLVAPSSPILADLLCLNAGAFARAGIDPKPILEQARALARSMDGQD